MRERAGRHRRSGHALIERRDHVAPPPRRRGLPAPSPAALVGIAVLVLIALGAIHLSTTGSAVDLDEPDEAMTEQAAASADAEESGDAAAGPSVPTAAPDAVDAVEASPGTGELVVHVSGAVAAPGVVRLPAGSRVDDALHAAGGASEEAELSAVNLARPVTDGEQIHVPLPDEEPPVPADPGPGREEPDAEDAPITAERGAVDLNTATPAELEELPGVGPAIAQRIIEHREKNGPFTSVDGLLEVSGIGPTTLEKIRDRATV